MPRSFLFEISFTFPTGSPPYTGVFTHHFTRVYYISKMILSRY
ncbi:2-C-methyl-D-erythritol 4-phosphate cytidylyltransferase [Bacillus pseudomycoides]|uniref:2-C-methyl-D-erythritol 4-phosphate cytidylyltransferase n=1 Tax=Bacillus pseudomycoides TaxID=64104 RepID=A0AA91ZUP3_9BACI|nr:2-C-methyl-D-erythritol 4-phosphate cytidylyltransferase [Bacillus sp. AFS098217]PED83577.1 2-C-methyl-D-erythritol 4-phosphate cytidylyltransferase [Bacillus pseudomycoides]PEU07148.1 2-C-methyl-D-erythritol 4-phosphate cytidylyltransferase [Bacillus sp. AFS019443]PEU17346.1 2-C-methyl-D-erythritol 4-phosphate cytidylyltransferase [Bacillus sp. AFS014408]PFW62765.1 2-C-methyl-D-erythritol 4-phosphate cytidylyltransferase [Bacillus sp. AFS075034]